MKSWHADVIKTGMYGKKLIDVLNAFIETISEYGNAVKYDAYSGAGIGSWIEWAKRTRVVRGLYGEIMIVKKHYSQELLLTGKFRHSVSYLPPILYREIRKAISLRPVISLDIENPIGKILKQKLENKKINLSEFFWVLIKLSGIESEIEKLNGTYKKRLAGEQVNAEDFEGTEGSNFIASAIEDIQKQIDEAGSKFVEEKKKLYADTWKKFDMEVEEMKKNMDEKIAQLKAEMNNLMENEFEGFIEKKESEE